ncbi:MAG: dihydroorotase [Actinobacteria bacterium]|nr:dihydroorotase [Actinomycetota bacterium]
MDSGILIKNGNILRFSKGKEQKADILIVDGIIRRIDRGIEGGSHRIIDAQDCIVAPGLVDMHTHLREPGMEHKEDIGTGSRAAVAGGFTAVFCMPNTAPCIDNRSVAEYVFDRGKEEGLCMVLPHGALTLGQKGEALASIGDMNACRAHVHGFSDDGNPVSDSEVMRRAMEYARTIGVLVISHAEEKALSEGGQINEGYYSTLLGLQGIPAEAEEIQVFRDIALAEKTGASLHVAHVSTAGSVRLLREAKKRGVPVTCEVTPHHLSLNDSMMVQYDTNLKMNPPLRSEKDVQAVLEGLADGTIDVIATDHAPHAAHEKEVEFDLAPFGVIGLETCLPVVLSSVVAEGVLKMGDAIRRLSAAPAEIMNMSRWGYVAGVEEGIAANLVIFNPDIEWTVDPGLLSSRSKNTPYRGARLKGKVLFTIYRGNVVLEDGGGTPAGNDGGLDMDRVAGPVHGEEKQKA